MVFGNLGAMSFSMEVHHPGVHVPPADEAGGIVTRTATHMRPAIRCAPELAVHQPMSALLPKADMCGATRDVRFVPIADIPEQQK